MLTSLPKAILFGLLVWLMPFVVAFLVFTLREAMRPLFESIMAVAVATASVAVALLYFRGVAGVSLREGLLVGVLWLIICFAIDAPLMLFGGPMQMTVGQYAADIGVTYLMIPVIVAGIAYSRSRSSTPQ